jgi:hypothetical protein
MVSPIEMRGSQLIGLTLVTRRLGRVHKIYAGAMERMSALGGNADVPSPRSNVRY